MKVIFSWSPGESQAKPSFRWDSNMNKQAPGYALLLVLLLLSIFISGASALARIVVLNLRQVRFVDQAIIASSAASSGIEYGLYQFRKAVPGDIAAVAGEKKIGVADVKITAELKEDTWLKIAKDDFAVITLPPSSGVVNVKFSDWTSASDCSAISWVEVIKTEWDPGNLTDIVVSRQPYSISDGLPDQTIDNAKLTQLRLKALYCDVSKIAIQGFNDQNQSTSLPSRVIIKSVGEYQMTRQSQQISTLDKEPLAGLFDYVLFSECSLTNKNNIECP